MLKEKLQGDGDDEQHQDLLRDSHEQQRSGPRHGFDELVKRVLHEAVDADRPDYPIGYREQLLEPFIAPAS